MAVSEIPVVLFSSDWAPKAVLKIGYGSQVSSQAIAEEKPRNIRLNVSGIFSQPASKARGLLHIISVFGCMSFFIMMILSSLFFAVVSVVRRRFLGLKVLGMLSPRRKSVSAPIQILLCAFDCLALFVIIEENPFYQSCGLFATTRGVDFVSASWSLTLCKLAASA